MAIESASVKLRSAKTIGFWALRILLALWFFTVGMAKLLGHPHMIAQFDAVGIGHWFRYFTGVLEISGAILLINTKTIAFGGAILTCVCVGAFVARLLAIHGDVMHDIIAALVLSAITWVHRSQIFGLLQPARYRIGPAG